MNGFSYILTTLEITSQEIAEKFSVTKRLISHLKKGDRNLTKAQEQILHSLTGIPIYYYNRELTRMDKFKIEEALLVNSTGGDLLNSLELSYTNLLHENIELKVLLNNYRDREIEIQKIIADAL